jgi:DNA replication protein DnaC
MADKSTDPTCEACDSSGWETVKDAAGVRRARKCEACDYWERRRGYAPGVPDDAKDAGLAVYGEGLNLTDQNRDAITQAKHFLAGVHPGLYIHGDVGSGKTLLACAILNDLHRQGQRVRFMRTQELLNKLMPGSDLVDVLFDQVVAVPTLVLDDVGASQGTDFARRMLLSIYEGRQDRSHRTVWTSNLDLDELTEFLAEDKRLASRIAGTSKIVRLDGIDYRLKAAKKRATKAAAVS